MWRPPERIKYQPQPGTWPDRERAKTSTLFSPVQIGPVILQQRTWVPAMVPWRATDEGHITDDVLAWYERFARGKPGAIVVEATGVRDVPSGPLLRIGHDRFIPGLRKLADIVRDASDGETKLFIQIIDFLRINRRPPAEKFFQRFLQITDAHRKYFYDELSDDDIREKLCGLNDEALVDALTEREYHSLTFGYRERVSDLHLAHIRELPETLPGLFSSAAVRARTRSRFRRCRIALRACLHDGVVFVCLQHAR